jgi:hypothetical protein
MNVERLDDTTLRPTIWFGAGRERGSVYVVRRGDDVLWLAGIDFGDASHVPFREELFWEATNTVVIGGGNVVYFFDTQGDLRAQISVPSLFGHLALAAIPTAAGNTEELLFILGWTDVHAIDSQFETAWVARGVAVDGIVFIEGRDDAVILSAEMDPPGGWVNVALDVHTGAELWRER